MERFGLRLRRAGDLGRAPDLSEWYPAVAELFAGRFWAADNFDSTPFGGVSCEYGDAAWERLLVKAPPAEHLGGPVLFAPDALDKHCRFAYNDWVRLYGLEEARVPLVLSRWQDGDLTSYFEQFAEPILRNADGCWWDIFSERIDEVRQRIGRLHGITIAQVEFGDWC